VRIEVRRETTQLARQSDTLPAEIEMVIPEQLRCDTVVRMTVLDEDDSERLLHRILPLSFGAIGTPSMVLSGSLTTRKWR
jgi:hypothetical protein